MNQTFLDLVPKGSRNAISRKKLCARSKKGDRQVRLAIQGNNRDSKSKVLILAKSNGDGYFQYASKEDDPYFDRYIAAETARAKTIMNKIEQLKVKRREILATGERRMI